MLYISNIFLRAAENQFSLSYWDISLFLTNSHLLILKLIGNSCGALNRRALFTQTHTHSATQITFCNPAEWITKVRWLSLPINRKDRVPSPPSVRDKPESPEGADSAHEPPPPPPHTINQSLVGKGMLEGMPAQQNISLGSTNSQWRKVAARQRMS